MIKILILLFLIIVLNCDSNNKFDTDIKDLINDYYSTYQERTNLDKFLSFYDSDILLEDMVNGDRISGIRNLKEFFDWENTDFVLEDSVALVITDQTVLENRVYTQGYFTPFSWSGTQVEAMQFYSVLYLNDKGKIIRQIDWINYPPYIVNHADRKNSNDWINNN